MRALLLLCLLALPLASHAKPQLQSEFDALGPAVKTLQSAYGDRAINYIDEGREDWRPVVFIGGGGTSGRVFALLEFLRTTRENLKLRIIAVERNGFGITAFDDSLGFADYAGDVEEVLEHLGVEKFSVFAISGGGGYSAHIISRNPERITSVHLAAALTYFDPASVNCLAPANALTYYTQNPLNWFGFPPESPIHKIPGFQDAAYDDAARTFNINGQVGAPDALFHELQLYCVNQQLPDLAAVTAPVFLYYGDADDTVVPDIQIERWQSAYVNAELELRLYAGEGHDVQYRHLDQILVDLAGLKDRFAVCDREGHTKLVKGKKLEKVLSRGGSLGICAWQTE